MSFTLSNEQFELRRLRVDSQMYSKILYNVAEIFHKSSLKCKKGAKARGKPLKILVSSSGGETRVGIISVRIMMIWSKAS